MSNEYLPLAEHLKGEGLKEGTVLEIESGDRLKWDGVELLWVEGSYSPDYPFSHRYRIVSTPPKKITFETTIQHGGGHNPQYVYLPEPVDFVRAIVTVEEKR